MYEEKAGCSGEKFRTNRWVCSRGLGGLWGYGKYGAQGRVKSSACDKIRVVGGLEASHSQYKCGLLEKP